MNSKDAKFEKFRDIMFGEGYDVTGVYDHFMATLEAVPGRADMPRITYRYDHDGVFVRVGTGPFEHLSTEKPELFVDLVIKKHGLSDTPF